MEQIISNVDLFLAGGKIHTVYWALAVFGSVFFAITCLLTIFGLGGLSDADLDSADVTMDHLDTGYLDFNLFSIRSILAFITVFGWGGVLWGHHGFWGFVGAFCAGFLTMVITAFVIWIMMKLQCSGTIPNEAFVGCSATVYLSIPAGGEQTGKIVVTLNGATHELRACAEEEIPTGAAVEIVKELSNRTFLVKKSV